MKSISTSVPNWQIRVEMAERATIGTGITSAFALPVSRAIDARSTTMTVRLVLAITAIAEMVMRQHTATVTMAMSVSSLRLSFLRQIPKQDQRPVAAHDSLSLVPIQLLHLLKLAFRISIPAITRLDKFPPLTHDE